MSTNQPRQPKGVPAGGQWRAARRPEGPSVLGPGQPERDFPHQHWDEVEVTEGAARWRSSGNCLPADLVEVALEEGLITAEVAEATTKARQAQVAEAGRRALANDHEPSDEVLYEMRAAFGPGTTVVNVVTGRRTEL